MMNRANEPRANPSLIAFAVGALFVLGVIGVGCDDSSNKLGGPGAGTQQTAESEQAPAEQPQSRPERRAEPDEPERVSLATLDLPESVDFPAVNAPTSLSIAESVAQLASAIASGDSRSLHTMLDEPGQAILDRLVESGAWEETTESISSVRVCSLDEGANAIRVGLGVENQDGAYLLGWEGRRLGSGWTFGGIALETPAMADTAAQLDGASLAARPVPEPGEIVDDTFDPTINDPRRDQDQRRRRSRGGRRF